MNENHNLCSTPEWAEWLQAKVLPYLVRDVDLGDAMLEVGPGPGAATDWLRHRVRRLVTLESDHQAAARLIEAYEGTNVSTLVGDATAMDFEDASFDSVGSFTMLHHVPSVTLQNLLFSEVLRVLRPGCVFIGSDSLPSDALHQFHEADTYNPVDPGSLIVRLQTIGFERFTVSVDGSLNFIAYKPGQLNG
jgi:SAM-dependent methyltransferase